MGQTECETKSNSTKYRTSIKRWPHVLVHTSLNMYGNRPSLGRSMLNCCRSALSLWLGGNQDGLQRLESKQGGKKEENEIFHIVRMHSYHSLLGLEYA